MLRLTGLSQLFSLLLAITVSSSCAHGQEQGVVVLDRQYNFVKSREIRVPVKPDGSVPDVVVIRNGEEMYFASGKPAANLGEMARRRAPAITAPAQGITAPPVENRILPIRSPDGQLRAGLSEVMPGTDVYVAARHVLQGLSPETIQNALSASGKSAKEFTPFEFRDASGVVDAILFVPSKTVSLVLEVNVPNANCDACTPNPVHKLLSLPHFRREVTLDSQFYSRQYGMRGHQEVEQVSRGTLSAMNADSYFLNLTPSNATTLKSSGSVVQVSPAGKEDYGIGGIVECVVPPSVQSGVAVQGGVRVIPIRRLLESEARSTSIDRLSSEEPKPRGLTGDCVPTDGRGAGGG